MASFSEQSFDAQGYSSNRPSYPPALYSYIADCTRSPASSSDSPRTVVDLGCGPGLSSFGFLDHFDSVIGVEPGEGMVQVAREILQQQPKDVQERMRFEQGTAEDLSLIVKEDASVDLVVACTSAHWFKDPLAVYRELARVLKPNGSFFFFTVQTYSTLHFPHKPEFESLLPQFSDEILGPYWSEPGHRISETLLAAYPLPYASNFPDHGVDVTARFDPDTFKRSFFLVSKETPLPPLIPKEVEREGLEVDRFDNDPSRMLRRIWGLEEVKNLLNTWSASHSWNQAHPGRDCAGEFVERLKEAGWREGEEHEVVWEIGTLYGRKSN
ncbi:class I SAM-dependent methyltransferase [Sporobolomyces salmoneus]|uniref:class I SAM-dependent methyltransferase n=1 Tax=Sporobolomyces salmoneus TaxID=183962 RepID=UPI003177DB7E